jgi:hypothetical protein
MSASFGKREREKKKQERAAEKRERRQDRSASSEKAADNGLNEDELMERFRVLSERFEAKTISREDYEAERAQIFTELGVADSLS